MNELKVFENENFGNVRVVVKDGEPWFVAKDVSEILGYRTANDMTRILDEDEKDTHLVSTLGGEQNMIVINESGLYSAVIRSKKEKAKKFKKWVTSEVLPSIRKHGAYMTDNVIDNIMNNPAFLKDLVLKLEEESRKRKELEKREEENRPKVAFADKILKSKDNILIRDLAKIISDEGISIGEKRLYKWLRNKKILMNNNTPYQQYVDRKYFVVEERSFNTPFGEKLSLTTKVTPAGQLYIVNKIKEEYGQNID
jgi:prophage antirepressor-like protein